MSHAYGQVRFCNGTVMHFEYDGTTDRCINPLRDTVKEVVKNWRKYIDSEKTCTCDQDEEPVEIATDYGDGHHWHGMACKACKVITKGMLYIDGLPDWWVDTD